jgi:hypothetical protein
MSDFDLDFWCNMAAEFDPTPSTRAATAPVDNCTFCGGGDLFESFDMGMICRGCARVQPRGPALLAEYSREAGTHTIKASHMVGYTPARNFAKLVNRTFGRNSDETAAILRRHRQFLAFFDEQKTGKNQPHLHWQLSKMSALVGTALILPLRELKTRAIRTRYEKLWINFELSLQNSDG